MACSKYASTRQTTHTARISRLLFGPCTDVLRDVLRKHFAESTFITTLQNKRVKGILFGLRNFQASQKELLYPKGGSFSGSYEDFDISLLYLLLRNIANITPHNNGWGSEPDENDRSVSANIERIRMIRNQIGAHCHRPDLSDAAFSTSWASLKRSVVEIVNLLGIKTNFEKCVNDLAKEVMDPEREEYWMEHLHKQMQDDAERYEEIKTDMMELRNKVEKCTSDINTIDSRLDKIENGAANVTAPSKGLDPSSYTLEGVFKDIENMRMSPDGKVRYCVLAFVFIYSQINTKDIGLDDFNEDFEEIASIASLENIIDQDIKNAIENLQGQYLRTPNEDGIYKFSDETVLNAVLLSVGQLRPATIIKKSNARIIYRLIRTEKYKVRPGETILKIPERHYKDLVEKLFDIYTSDDHFNAIEFLGQPCTDDDELTNYVFSGIQTNERIKRCCEIIYFVSRHNKPGLIKSMLKNHCSDCKRNDAKYMFGNFIDFCSQHSSNKFVLTDFDIHYLLDESIYYKKAENVLTICRYISKKDNCGKYFCRDVKKHTCNLTGYTVLQHCVFKDWKDIVNIILSGYTPSTLEMCGTLSWCVYRGKSNITLELCRYICKLENANEYFDSNMLEVHCDYNLMFDSRNRHTCTGFTILHCCVIKDWKEAVSVILGVNTPKKTDKNWTCAHIAAFFGRDVLLKKFVEMGQTVTDKTEEGYSVFQCLLLGIRYIDKKSSTFYSLDVNETSSFIGEVSLDYHSYKESFHYLVSVNSSSSLSKDVSLKLDEHGNHVIHYLVIHNCNAMLETLLNLNRDISHHRNETGLPTALHLALYLGRHNMVKKLWMNPLPSDPNDIQEAIKEGRKHCGKIFRFSDTCKWDEFSELGRNPIGKNLKLSTVKFLEVKFGSENDFDLTEHRVDKLIKSSKRLKAD